jgi:hypothetical protein
MVETPVDDDVNGFNWERLSRNRSLHLHRKNCGNCKKHGKKKQFVD